MSCFHTFRNFAKFKKLLKLLVLFLLMHSKRMRYKMPSASCFLCYISAWKFMLAYIYIHDCNFLWGGG